MAKICRHHPPHLRADIAGRPTEQKLPNHKNIRRQKNPLRPSFPRKRKSNAPARAPLRGFNYERALRTLRFAICGGFSAVCAFAQIAKWQGFGFPLSRE
ncbi:MAG: hypothetical protein ACR2P4_09280 [Gammaproteobacteria bacterium]